ncbi:MAG: DUF2855 family protein [Pseudomonadota bacterium]
MTDGSIVLAVDSFALTANNVTYALFGDALGYWRFYPASADGWGRVPVWGFARVVESGHPEVAVGSSCFGFLPMAHQFAVNIGSVNAERFVAADEHRRELPGAYNLYRVADENEPNDSAARVHTMVFRPLFLTAFLIADVLDEKAPDASVIVSSASSKTALALAAEARRRGGRHLIGLTSPSNIEFVTALDLYDDVVAYSDAANLAATTSVFVDIAGNGELRNAIHAHLDQALILSLAVGASHGAVPTQPPTAGPHPELFFAPQVYNERIAAIGTDAFDQNYLSGWRAFGETARNWLAPQRLDGLDAGADAWRSMLAGTVPPSAALIVQLSR